MTQLLVFNHFQAGFSAAVAPPPICRFTILTQIYLIAFSIMEMVLMASLLAASVVIS